MKQDRIEFRSSHSERIQMERAALVLGMNLSSYLRMAALERSEEILRESSTFILQNKERDEFLTALENPIKPNKALKQALKHYRRSMSDGRADAKDRSDQ
jgi:uncharacterized protein (DUF1778 family)